MCLLTVKDSLSARLFVVFITVMFSAIFILELIYSRVIFIVGFTIFKGIVELTLCHANSLQEILKPYCIP